MKQRVMQGDVKRKRVPFSIECYGGCGGGDHIGSRRQAVREGWKDINREETPTAYYTGICPECINTESDPDPCREADAPLFTEAT